MCYYIQQISEMNTKKKIQKLRSRKTKSVFNESHLFPVVCECVFLIFETEAGRRILSVDEDISLVTTAKWEMLANF